MSNRPQERDHMMQKRRKVNQKTGWGGLIWPQPVLITSPRVKPLNTLSCVKNGGLTV